MSGRLIVLEGLDGSGKATQAGLLYEALCGRGEQAMKITFPNYESDSSALVKMYLGGAFGQDVNDVNAYAASSFYSVDRYASYKTLWGRFYHDGGTVIADRYTTSNAVHQCSKLPREEWDCLLYTSGRLKDKMVSPQDAMSAPADTRAGLVAKVYGAYQKRLLQAGAFDFDDLIYATVKLLRDFEDVREYYQNRFRYILVDEYQDTSVAQFQLVYLLLSLIHI